MKYLSHRVLLIGLFCLVCFTGSCRKDYSTQPSNGQLRFSKDTILLDTLFTTIGSSTYQLTVYNDSPHDITIPTIQLKNGANSRYRLNVDGVPGKTFQNIDILAKDSIFIFVETTVNIHDFAQNSPQFLYTDQIQFDVGANQQNISLITLVKDAHFLFPDKLNNSSTETLTLGVDQNGDSIKVSGFFLASNELHFTADKPYVIYGYAAVPPHKTLTIDPGARIYFHTNGGIIVANNASIHVNGTISQNPKKLENEVIFQGDRLEDTYQNTPDQWKTIWLTAGSTDNHIRHAIIKNSTVGIRMDSNDGGTAPTLQISNTQIYNCATVGLWATTGFIEGKNLVINNCGQAALYLSLGGNYNFYNSTFVNYWTKGYREFPAVLISNSFSTANQTITADLTAANFYNCIIYGNQEVELLLHKSAQAAFQYKFENCLISFNPFNSELKNNPLYDFTNSKHYTNNLLNKKPHFLNPLKNMLIIGEKSAANGFANPTTATVQDILGKTRGNNPDSGAYESIPFP